MGCFERLFSALSKFLASVCQKKSERAVPEEDGFSFKKNWMSDEVSFFELYIRKAVVFIDSRLSCRYMTPIPEPVPAIVTNLCADLAASFIFDQHMTATAAKFFCLQKWAISTQYS
ncbi:phage protein Gp36 family protein [Aneurinibacillus terranovensis]|uniref:phage protein Gp36 family protein n=1 Tax=Aneurinibacillus terranovensis TaxID=278991 RepID=UPI000402ABEA|nr:phage protein Gp36 family protein [Aneurinibacillus terranovensis]